MDLLVPFGVKDKIFPYKYVLIPQFALKFKLLRFNFCCNSMMSQPLPSVKTQLSQKEEVGC